MAAQAPAAAVAVACRCPPTVLLSELHWLSISSQAAWALVRERRLVSRASEPRRACCAGAPVCAEIWRLERGRGGGATVHISGAATAAGPAPTAFATGCHRSSAAVPGAQPNERWPVATQGRRTALCQRQVMCLFALPLTSGCHLHSHTLPAWLPHSNWHLAACCSRRAGARAPPHPAFARAHRSGASGAPPLAGNCICVHSSACLQRQRIEAGLRSAGAGRLLEQGATPLPPFRSLAHRPRACRTNWNPVEHPLAA